MQTEPVTKNSRFGIVTVFLILASLAAIGLGYWGYTLDNSLRQTQNTYEVLKVRHQLLTKDKDAIRARLEKEKAALEEVRTELEEVNKDLSSQQAKLKKAQDAHAKVQARVDTAIQYMDVMVGYWVRGDDLDEIGALVDALGDEQMTKKFEAFVKDDDKFAAWAKYVFDTILELLSTD